MSENRFKKLGVEKPKNLDKNFDIIYEKYKEKALNAGYTGDLKFVKEKGKIIVYVVI